MSTGLNPTTVARAGPIIADAFGLKWSEDRLEVMKVINKIRNKWFNLYEDFSLFNDLAYCMCVSTFRERCAINCGPRGVTDCYQGFTLPKDLAAVEAVWSHGMPLTTRSRWRETLVGLGPIGPRVETFEMAELFATERDMTEITSLKVFAEHPDDEGKHVVVKVIDCDGREKNLDFCLKGDVWAVISTKVREIREVSLPADRKGYVTLAQKDGHELSQYDPFETVPSYRRFKVALSNCPSTVKIQGVRRFTDVYFDHDIVEIGDILILESGARYFKYKDGTKDASEINMAEYHLNNMKTELAGLIARHRGNSRKDGAARQGRPLPRRIKKLPGYR